MTWVVGESLRAAGELPMHANSDYGQYRRLI